jgi:hypothetical protein
MLFAHPYSNPALELPSLRSLRVTYGMFDDAWSNGARTDGVCFRIYAIASRRTARKLHERCLAPVEHAQDRADQQFAARLDIAEPVTLVFETDCGRSCSWDWAYWKDIDVVR